MGKTCQNHHRWNSCRTAERGASPGDRPFAAHDLLEDILAYFEQVYQGQSSSQWLKAAACLELLLKGLRQLEVNASVSLVLSMTLINVQQEVQN